MSESNKAGNIPITDFYGESRVWPVADTLHCEQLNVRSARYDWKIKPHRHVNLMQIFYVMDGAGVAELDHRRFDLYSGDLLIIPQQCVHTFRWEEQSTGYVLFIAGPMQSKLECILDGIPWAYESDRPFSTTNNKGFPASLFATLYEEYQSKRLHREVLLENLVLTLCIWINRQYREKVQSTIQRKSRRAQRLEKFTKLIGENYTQHHTVEWYAERVGITAAHLNSLCKQQHQQSALSIIHQRLLAEAQRNLIYTGKSTADVADLLGFSDAAYFNRFFKRLTGATPGAFRKSWRGNQVNLALNSSIQAQIQPQVSKHHRFPSAD